MQADGIELSCFLVNQLYPSWTEYLKDMAKDGNWGDHLILFAAANCFKCNIRVISSVPNQDCTIRPVPPISDTDPLVLGHVFEQHYVSLRPSIPGND